MKSEPPVLRGVGELLNGVGAASIFNCCCCNDEPKRELPEAEVTELEKSAVVDAVGTTSGTAAAATAAAAEEAEG